MANVYSLVADVTHYKNNDISGASIPLTNLSGTYPGPFNPSMLAPYPPPNFCAVGAGGGPVFAAGQEFDRHKLGCKEHRMD